MIYLKTLAITITCLFSINDFAKISGQIIFFDGLPASGKSTLSQKLYALYPSSILISSDDLANEQISYGKAANLALEQALDLANAGKIVLLDSFFMTGSPAFEKMFAKLKAQNKIYSVLLFCHLPIMLERFEQRSGNALSPERKRYLENDFQSKYLTDAIYLMPLPSKEILYCQNPFDLVLDSSHKNPEALLEDLLINLPRP